MQQWKKLSPKKVDTPFEPQVRSDPYKNVWKKTDIKSQYWQYTILFIKTIQKSGFQLGGIFNPFLNVMNLGYILGLQWKDGGPSELITKKAPNAQPNSTHEHEFGQLFEPHVESCNSFYVSFGPKKLANRWQQAPTWTITLLLPQSTPSQCLTPRHPHQLPWHTVSMWHTSRFDLSRHLWRATDPFWNKYEIETFIEVSSSQASPK
jgi:hypothetical protein